MPNGSPALAEAISDLEDSYLQVMLLLAVRRARSEEPRRAALWHALAVLLAEEQERRRQEAALAGSSGADVQELVGAIDAARAELRRDAEALEAEYQEALGKLERPLDAETPATSTRGPLAPDPAPPAGGAGTPPPSPETAPPPPGTTPPAQETIPPG